MRSFNTRRRVTTGAVDKKDKPTVGSKIMRRSSTASSDSTPIDDTFRNEVELEFRYGSVRRFFGFSRGITSSPREHNSNNSNSNVLLLIKLFAVIFVIVACTVEVVSHLSSKEVPSSPGGDYGGNGSYSIDIDETDDFYSNTHIAKDEEKNVVPKKSSNQQPEESLIAQQFGVDPFKDRDKIEMIQKGEMNFAGIRYSSTSFEEDGSSKYSDVYAEFCVYNLQLNKDNPSYYSKSQHIIAESTHCGEHRFSISMSELMGIKIGDGIKELPLSGMLFHQGYSGGGLIANALTAFNVHVVSEHTALHASLNACSYIHNRYQSDNCSSTKQQRLVQDVIKLLSRTTDQKIDHLFLKFESASSAYISMLHSLFSDVKWTFSYRDAEEVLAKNMQRKRNNTCIKTKSSPSTALSNKANEKNINLQDLSSHEICALHLSTLLEAAIEEHNSSGTGMLVSYTDVLTSDIILDKVLPYFDLELDATMRERVSVILKTKSNTRGSTNDKIWDKSQEDDIEIGKEVHEAVATYMSGVVDGWDDEM